MKIRVIGSKKEISSLAKNDTLFHISFQPSTEDLIKLVQRCPGTEAIEMSPLRHRNTHEPSRIFMESVGVQLLNGKLWGHRGDMKKYYEVPDSVIKTIKQLKKTGRSEDQIVREISGIGKFSDDLLRFIVGR